MDQQSTRALAGLATLVAAASTALGAEVTVQNDDVEPLDPVTVCPCFAAGEEAAVWLTSPCNGSIVAIQIFWRSEQVNQPQVIEDSIDIRTAGTYPTPGAVLETLEAPVLTDGVINEYRFLDEQQTIPIDVPVSAGQEFVVAFKFFNPNLGTSGPSLVFDDAPTPNKNAIFANGFGWVPNSFFSVNGDWFIRAVIDCDPVTTGACCLGGNCTEGFTSPDCVNAGGTFLGLGVLCEGDPCGALVGACCLGMGCVDGQTEPDCTGAGGVFQGLDTTCSTGPCDDVPGACCIPSTGGCLALSESDCVNQVAGNWQGFGTTCPDACAPTCVGDIDGDNDTDVFDFNLFASKFGTNVPPGTMGDFTGDGTVNVFDFNVFAPDFGCPNN